MRIFKRSRVQTQVTGKRPNCEGSITLGQMGGILPDEQVHVYNATTGERFVTYAIQGGGNDCILNGAAARLGEVGDEVIIVTYEVR